MTQLDLFGAVEAAEDAATVRAREAAEWFARFERADWVAPWDCADGTPKGTVIQGWRCPDPECGGVEVNNAILGINHGLDPHSPRSELKCFRVRWLRLRERAA